VQRTAFMPACVHGEARQRASGSGTPALNADPQRAIASRHDAAKRNAHEGFRGGGFCPDQATKRSD